jgi:hypothetical protein
VDAEAGEERRSAGAEKVVIWMCLLSDVLVAAVVAFSTLSKWASTSMSIQEGNSLRRRQASPGRRPGSHDRSPWTLLNASNYDQFNPVYEEVERSEHPHSSSFISHFRIFHFHHRDSLLYIYYFRIHHPL